MSEWDPLYADAWIVDVSAVPMSQDPLIPFVFEEILCADKGAAPLDRPLVHIWRHRKAVILGLRDSRLPHASQAAKELQTDGWQVAVRHSGGAAVPLDAGVVNVSVVWPKRMGAMRHHQDFAGMFKLIERVVKENGNGRIPGVQTGEVPGGYCPGEYDLSLAGRKFCGLAQRRKLAGYVVQAFIVVEGSGPARAERIRAFYETAGGGAAGDVPHIVPAAMASLSELAGDIRSEDWIAGLYEVLRPREDRIVQSYDRWIGNPEMLSAMLDTLKSRYGLQAIS